VTVGHSCPSGIHLAFYKNENADRIKIGGKENLLLLLMHVHMPRNP
jgi:hypothetical protein